jgi:multidrug resistance protein, MATE family
MPAVMPAHLRVRSADLRATVRLALPVVVVQIGLMGMGVVDTVIVGHLSAQALASVALGNLYFILVCSGSWGLLLALDPLVAQAVGARDEVAVIRAVQRGLLLAAALSVPSMLALLPGELVLPALGQPAEVVPTAAVYARIIAPGLPAFLAFVVLRQTLQAMGQMRPILIVIVAANLLNAGLDWLLVFGKLGCPELGAPGSAWATLASRWLMAFGLLVAARGELAPLLEHLDRAVLELKPLLRMVRLGLPIGVQFQLEFAAFGVIALLMGWLGPVAMGGHQVAITLASLTYMVPLGVSAACAVLVGHAVGRGDPDEVRRFAVAGILCGGGFMAACAVTLVGFPGLLAAAFTSAPEVRLLAATLIPVAGFFQVFDGLQVVASGILRGLGDTRVPMVVNLLGFWVAGLPVSLLLSFALDLGPTGLWWGFVAGLGAVAALLLGRVASRLGGPIRRVVIDAPRPPEAG